MGRPSKTFGIPESASAIRNGRGRGKGRFVKVRNAHTAGHTDVTTANSAEDKFVELQESSQRDERFGFGKYEAGPTRQGWLVNMHSTLLEESEYPSGRAAVDFYFLQDDGSSFKSTIAYEPYFFIATTLNHEAEVEEFVRRKFEGLIRNHCRVLKEDLKMPNHLTGYRRTFIKLSFANVNDLFEVKRFLAPIVERNKTRLDANDAYNEVIAQQFEYEDDSESAKQDPLDCIVDLREYDVPYHVRVAIDLDIRIGKWYNVQARHGIVTMTVVEERITRADPVIMAYDIETTKLPLKFPDAAIDQIMMISYMIDGEGFLITNREIVSQDIDDFEYTPKTEFNGPFVVFNERDEKAVIERFFSHIQDAKPTVMVTYNGDFFDWPFVETRARINDIDMYAEIGFRKNSEDVYESRHCAHMDAFAWVKRDSYLPQGSQGLKAVTTAKLGYDPIELDPELMLPYALEQPQILAQYSVSDAVATYYLYMKYCHPFIFSLCNIIPLNPDEVLRKGTGTLCEMLLMVKAYQDEIILPNKYNEQPERFFEGHLLESETYVGGHVESLEAGVFRKDIPEKFSIDPTAVQGLIDDLDHALKFSIEVEAGKSLQDVEDYDSIRGQILAKLENLRDHPIRHDCPKIYHLDVASMYPNIMTTNRLQPDSMIDESNCATCDFNRPGKTCDKKMTWSWRGEFYPLTKGDYNMLKNTLSAETFPARFAGQRSRTFADLSASEQMVLIKERVSTYSKSVYHKLKETKTIERETIVCQRENPFYVNTVKSFRDRRYEYKGQQKTWKRRSDELGSAGTVSAELEEAKKLVILYDSLQLAHKVILNSFYGYVMRKGSRWYSMEMAGVTCLTGATIIQLARQLVERIGRPLELDTDGIWCILPDAFPENFVFRMKNGKPLFISYPCVMLNHLVHAKFTNHQYEDLTDGEKFKYVKHSENSIFFEVDGPYRAMILPTSKEENKNLKKRYAVFNDDGTLAELKGFEVKRRGELKLIKVFQTQVFKVFLDGKNLQECYAAVARVADKWLDVLYSKGSTLADDELVELVCENRSMSKTITEYGTLKSTSISTAKRLAEFLGDQMIKDKGLACKYIISALPIGCPITERAIPIAIFSADESIKRHFLRKWLKDPGCQNFDLRSIIDWNYYLERFGSVIQKLITMPAAMQKIPNPVPRVAHPDWLNKQLAAVLNPYKQSKLTQFLSETKPGSRILQPNTDTNILNRLKTAGKPIKRKERAKEQRTVQPEVINSLALDGHESSVALPSGKMVCAYTLWLRHQKRKWTIQRASRNRRRQLIGEDEEAMTHRHGIYNQLQAGAANRLTHEHYTIISLTETEQPGLLKAWTIIGTTFSSIKVKVPRTFYVNFRGTEMPDVEITDCDIKKVHAKLPNGQIATNLFMLSMPETVYQRSQEQIQSLVTHRLVEGVYELNVRPIARAIMKMQNSCRFTNLRPGALAEAMASGFDLTSLEPTLNESVTDSLQYVLIFHAVAGPREIALVVTTGASRAMCIVLDPAETSVPNYERLYSELRAELAAVPSYPTNMQISTLVVNSAAKQRKAINEAFKSAKSPNSVLVLSTPSASFSRHIATASQPVMYMPAKSAVVSTLNWQQTLGRSVILRYLECGSWLDYRKTLANYGRVPICNLATDEARVVIDYTMARQLKAQDVILWWNEGAQPDYGGREADDLVKNLDSVEATKVNHSGGYNTVCIELEVRNLIISTMLNSALINDMEGSANMDSFNDGAEVSGDMQDKEFMSPSIACFQEVLKSWWKEATQGVREADIMIDNAVRWLQSSISALYDKNLDLYAQRITNKAFLQLLAEFRKVGSKIVFGAPGRVIIQTSKNHIATAYAYSQYIVKSIRSKPLFHFIDMQIVEYWDYLLWLDEVNYGGYCCKEITDAEHQEMVIAMTWNISNFLPPMLAEIFADWVIEFMGDMYDVKKQMSDFTVTQKLEDQANDLETKMGTVIGTISQPLIKQIQQLVARYTKWSLEADPSDDTFIVPKQPGTHLSKEEPVLSLVKYLCTVFCLPTEVQIPARILRRDLLAVVDTKEFSNAARYIDPCKALILPRHCCTRCSDVRDLQFCRDPALAPKIKPAGGIEFDWRCSRCDSSFDRLAIQEQLVFVLQSILASYQLQDLRCGKCKKVKSNNMALHCECSGKWALTLKKGQVMEQIKIMKNVSEYYQMDLLAGAIRELAMA